MIAVAVIFWVCIGAISANIALTLLNRTTDCPSRFGFLYFLHTMAIGVVLILVTYAIMLLIQLYSLS